MQITSTGVVQLSADEMRLVEDGVMPNTMQFTFECAAEGLNHAVGQMRPGLRGMTAWPKVVEWADISETCDRARVESIGRVDTRYVFSWTFESIHLSSQYALLRGDNGRPFLLIRHQMSNPRLRNVVASVRDRRKVRQGDGTVLKGECIAFPELCPHLVQESAVLNYIAMTPGVQEAYRETVAAAREAREAMAARVRDETFAREAGRRSRNAARTRGADIVHSMELLPLADPDEERENAIDRENAVRDAALERRREREDVERTPGRRMRR